ncbi:hypothetical protein [Pseudomonas viridiflava]|uniref:hypothetical protein n=1 Tax=Pseudomonas viridiflava TaxID=33069 RepID=UPI000F013F71|nr:hypothetical protein [Pseudomonas viridiflava]MEE4232713.1 hypothetical protein [Pseudomonas viridiflava]
MTDITTPTSLDQLSTSEAIQLAPAMTELRALRLPEPFDYYAATYLVQIAQVSSDYDIGHFEGQGLGIAMGLHLAKVITEEECGQLRLVFKDATDRRR